MAEGDVVVTGYQYRLRAGAPMGISGATATFVLHTFMAEKTEIDNYLCTNILPLSTSFRGQGGDLMQASFNRLQDVGGNTFQGRIMHEPEYIDEDDLNFNTAPEE